MNKEFLKGMKRENHEQLESRWTVYRLTFALLRIILMLHRIVNLLAHTAPVGECTCCTPPLRQAVSA